MLNKIILILGITLTAALYVRIIISYIFQRKNNNITASELSLKILDNEYTINLIKSKESIFSKYNIKRKMVKLSSNTYDSNTTFSLAVASILSGYSKLNNKQIEFIGKIFKEIKFISFSPIVAMIASSLSTNAGDAKLCIILLILIAIYQYILNTINEEVVENVENNNKDVNKILKLFTSTTKLSFIITLTQIIRLIVLILDI